MQTERDREKERERERNVFCFDGMKRSLDGLDVLCIAVTHQAEMDEKAGGEETVLEVVETGEEKRRCAVKEEEEEEEKESWRDSPNSVGVERAVRVGPPKKKKKVAAAPALDPARTICVPCNRFFRDVYDLTRHKQTIKCMRNTLAYEKKKKREEEAGVRGGGDGDGAVVGVCPVIEGTGSVSVEKDAFVMSQVADTSQLPLSQQTLASSQGDMNGPTVVCSQSNLSQWPKDTVAGLGSQNMYKCETCGEVVRTKDALHKHRYRSHPEQVRVT